MEDVTRPKSALATVLLPLLLLSLPVGAPAQFSYLTNNGTITIAAYEGADELVTVPAFVDDLPVTCIGHDAFSGRLVRSVIVSNGVVNIGEYAFSYCTRLTNIVIPESITGIGDFAFEGCRALTHIAIPSGVTNIGEYAFANCTFLTDATIPESVTSMGYQPFLWCYSLSAITVALSNPVFCSVDGVLFDKSRTTLIECPAGKAGTFTVPATTTNIESGAFDSCYELARVNFRANAPTAYNSAFTDAPVTIYYLPGTLGWTNTFAGRPTALWKPLIETSDASFGLRTNKFGFNISWASGMALAVDACTDLAHYIWTPLQTNTLTSDTLYFSDSQWANYPNRFYRLRWP